MSESITTKSATDIDVGHKIRDIREPGYNNGWNNALDAAAKACDENGWSWKNGCCETESKASNVILALKELS